MNNNGVYLDPTKRHDFVLLFDVTDGNPNGDPDAGNLPRVDPETMQGLVTDVCIKRKVRDWVKATHGSKASYEIYVEHRGILANQQKRAFKDRGPTDSPDNDARKWMCGNFYDIRIFGAVMTTGKSGQKKNGKELQWNCGQVRGPIQLTFSRSVDPIIPLDLSITRVALTNAGDTGRGEEDAEQASSGQMGRKAIVPYGLYIGHGFVNPVLGLETGLTKDDLEIFFEALEKMWELDRSASRGFMTCRGVYIFTHENKLGNAPAHRLFERISVSRNKNVEAPRKITDYTVTVDDRNLPEGVTLTALGV